MNILFEGQIAKDANYPEANEDFYGLDLENGRLAISDGASESFDSKTWASLLVSKFLREPDISPQWLADIIKDYVSHFDPASMSWSKQAAFERGSFATLVGLEIRMKKSIVDVLSVGDSLVILLDGTKFVRSFPYKQSNEFQQRPELFCTLSDLNSFFSSGAFSTKHCESWEIGHIKDPIVLCMTDALAEWALKAVEEGQPKWKILTEIDKLSDFEDLVSTERKLKAMRIDDTTLIRAYLKDFRNDELSDS